MKNHNIFEEEVTSESVGKARDYRSERHCERKEFSEKRSQECNRNCSHFQHVERSDEDDVESGYFEFQNNQEQQEIFNQILKNDMISSETKRSCATKLYEVTKKVELEESDDTLSSKMSNEKDNLPENKEEKLRHTKKQLQNIFNTNVNSFSKINQKSKKNFRTTTSKAEKLFDSEVGFNNNAEGSNSSVYYTPTLENPEELYVEFERLQRETDIQLKEVTNKLLKAKTTYEKLQVQQRSVAEEAIQNSMEMQRKTGQPEASALNNFISRVSRFFGYGCRRGRDPDACPSSTFEQIRDEKAAFDERVRIFNKPPSTYNFDDYYYRGCKLQRRRPYKEKWRLAKWYENLDDVFE